MNINFSKLIPGLKKALPRIERLAVRIPLRVSSIFIAGLVGGPVYLSIGMTALIMGTGAGLYLYGKTYIQEKKKEKNTPVLSRSRAKRASRDFMINGATGALGGGLRHAGPAFKVAAAGIKRGAEAISNVFNIHSLPLWPAAVTLLVGKDQKTKPVL